MDARGVVKGSRWRLPDLFRTAAFRLALAYGGAFVLSTLPLFAVIYWQTAVVETARIDAFLVRQAQAAADGPPERLAWLLGTRLGDGLHRLTFAATFGPDGRLLAGNLQLLPAGLPADGRAYAAEVQIPGPDGTQTADVRAVARAMADGRILVLARDSAELGELRSVVLRVLKWGVLPALLLALATGALLSLRTMRRIKGMHARIERIMGGDLGERLPVRATGDEIDQLANSVNHMLDEIARLLDEIKGVGEDIAHDLRTPLSRVRVRLERSRDGAHSPPQMQDAIDRAIAGLDQALAIITALLRISEIENGRRRSGFAEVDLYALVQEIADLYGPIAEEKPIGFRLDAVPVEPVAGDYALLIEAVANLVGNAIKFTPAGGVVTLGLRADPAGPVLVVRDTGPGIAPAERAAVLKRFYRSDRSRHVEGSGLGLSLVAAIAKLHGFGLRIDDAGPGCLIELACQRQGPALAAGRAGENVLSLG